MKYLYTGLCHDLCDIFNVNYITTKCRTTSLEETSEDLGDARNIISTHETFLGQSDAPYPASEAASPPHIGVSSTSDPARNIASAGEAFSPLGVVPSPAREAASSPHSRIPPIVEPTSASFSEMEIEHLRHVEGSRGDDILADLIASPPRFMPSPRPSEGIRSPSVTIASAGMLSTPGPLSTEPSRSIFETPGTFEEGLGVEITLSDIPEQMSTADEVCLSFSTKCFVFFCDLPLKYDLPPFYLFEKKEKRNQSKPCGRKKPTKLGYKHIAEKETVRA